MSMRAVIVLATLGLVLCGGGGGDPVTRDEALKTVLDAAFPDPATARPETGRELFLAALGSKVFEQAQVGPFDLYAYKQDGLSGQKARKAVDDAAGGLKPVAELLTRRFPEQPGVRGQGGPRPRFAREHAIRERRGNGLRVEAHARQLLCVLLDSREQPA